MSRQPFLHFMRDVNGKSFSQYILLTQLAVDKYNATATLEIDFCLTSNSTLCCVGTQTEGFHKSIFNRD